MIFLVPVVGQSQDHKISVEQAVDIAIKNNLGLEAAAQRVNQSEQLIGSAVDISKTEIYYNKDLNNIAPNNLPLNVWGINQSFLFPTVYVAQRKVMEGKSELVKDQFLIDQQMLTFQVHKVYNEIVYWQEMLKNYQYLDSLYTSFELAANRRFEQGETNYLEKLTAETKKKEIWLQVNQINENIQRNSILLNQWLQADTNFTVLGEPLARMVLLPLDSANHPTLSYYADAMKLSSQLVDLEKQKLMPDLNATVFQGTNNGTGTQAYAGFQVGVAVPLWFGSQKAQIKAAKTGELILAAEHDNYKLQLMAKYQALQADLRQYNEGLTYYESTGKTLAKETIFYANQAYANGEINFLQYTQLLENAKQSK